LARRAVAYLCLEPGAHTTVLTHQSGGSPAASSSWELDSVGTASRGLSVFIHLGHRGAVSKPRGAVLVSLQ
jgi:hypothetical protein